MSHDEDGASRRRVAGSRLLIVVAVAAAVAMAVGLMLAPERQVLDGQVSGDEALAGRVADAVNGLGGGFRSLVVAEVTTEGYVWAGLGNSGPGRHGPTPAEHSLYEAGSVTKTFTGSLLAIAIERGEVSSDDVLSDHLPELDGTAAGAVTLSALAQHRSGLPPLGATALGGQLAYLLNENPYASSSTEQLLADAREAQVDDAPAPMYSNFGFALLGTALVRAAGVDDYASLLADRITGPVGMSGTTVGASDADVPADAVPGFAVNGTPTTRWTGAGYLPAGTATITSVADLAAWAQAHLDDTAPGVAALEPTTEDPAGGIGWAWFTSEVTDAAGETHEMVWHNGMTAGHSSVLAIDREAGRAVVVLGNTANPVDPIALALLYGIPASGPSPSSLSMLPWIVYGVALLLSLLALWRARRASAVLPIVGATLFAAFGLVLLWSSGPWDAVGGWAYGIALAPALAGVAVGGIRLPSLALRPRRRAWLSWAGIVVAGLLIIGAVQLW